jgi:spermidine/putrescine transport system substrate-binding protein
MTRRLRRITPRQAAALSRRDFLIRSGMLGAAGLSLPALLAACGGDDGGSESESDDTSGGGSEATGGLFFENWPAYIDEETVGLFTEATGIDLRYTEAFNDNNEYFAKVQPVLGRGDTIDPDILAPTYWMAARFILLGWAQKLPLDLIPNAKNLRDDLVKPTWDPTGEYTLPWQTGITGIAYNKSVTGRDLASINDLFDPAFNGKIGMLTEMRDTIGLILLGEGVDPSTITTFDDAAVAFDKLEQAKNDGQIRQFHGNDYMDDLNAGNFAACTGWSGDLLQLAKDNPDLVFVVPEEGGISWADAMLLVTGSPNGEAAAAWMDFVYDPENAARITEFVGYNSPVKGVKEVLVAKGGEAAAMAENPLVFPDDATLSRLRSFANLSEDEEAKFDERFAEITGA